MKQTTVILDQTILRPFPIASYNTIQLWPLGCLRRIDQRDRNGLRGDPETFVEDGCKRGTEVLSVNLSAQLG